MPKIDTTTIEGFDTMTLEQQVEALTNFEYPEADYTGYVQKTVFDKTASELADWKRKYNAQVKSEGEKATENEQVLKDLKEELEVMKKEKTISGYKASFITEGYSEALAEEAANAMANGEMDKVFSAQKKFLEQLKKDIKAETMKSTPKPPAGGAEKITTKAEFLKLDTKAQMEFIKENPDWKTTLK